MASDARPARPKAHRLKRLRHEGLKPPVQAGEGPTANAVAFGLAGVVGDGE